MIFNALPITAYRVSLRGPGAQLDVGGAGGQTPLARRGRR